MNGNRGTLYQREHEKDSASGDYFNNSEFWNFHYAVAAVNDVKAHIDTITSVTGKDKMSYVGYSQGTIMMTSILDQASQEG